MKIGDFGIARTLSQDVNRTKSGYIVGSEKYVAPELLRDREPTPASDLYSLGVVAYELLRGFPPFASDAPGPNEIIARKLTEESVPVRVVVSDLDISRSRSGSIVSSYGILRVGISEPPRPLNPWNRERRAHTVPSGGRTARSPWTSFPASRTSRCRSIPRVASSATRS